MGDESQLRAFLQQAIANGVSPQLLHSALYGSPAGGNNPMDQGTPVRSGPMQSGGASGPSMLTQPTSIGSNKAVIPLVNNAQPGTAKGARMGAMDFQMALAGMPKNLRDNFIHSAAEMGLEFLKQQGKAGQSRPGGGAIGGEAGPEVDMPIQWPGKPMADGGATLGGSPAQPAQPPAQSTPSPATPGQPAYSYGPTMTAPPDPNFPDAPPAPPAAPPAVPAEVAWQSQNWDWDGDITHRPDSGQADMWKEEIDQNGYMTRKLDVTKYYYDPEAKKIFRRPSGFLASGQAAPTQPQGQVQRFNSGSGTNIRQFADGGSTGPNGLGGGIEGAGSLVNGMAQPGQGEITSGKKQEGAGHFIRSNNPYQPWTWVPNPTGGESQGTEAGPLQDLYDARKLDSGDIGKGGAYSGPEFGGDGYVGPPPLKNGVGDDVPFAHGGTTNALSQAPSAQFETPGGDGSNVWHPGWVMNPVTHRWEDPNGLTPVRPPGQAQAASPTPQPTQPQVQQSAPGQPPVDDYQFPDQSGVPDQSGMLSGAQQDVASTPTDQGQQLPTDLTGAQQDVPSVPIPGGDVATNPFGDPNAPPPTPHDDPQSVNAPYMQTTTGAAWEVRRKPDGSWVFAPKGGGAPGSGAHGGDEVPIDSMSPDFYSKYWQDMKPEDLFPGVSPEMAHWLHAQGNVGGNAAIGNNDVQNGAPPSSLDFRGPQTRSISDPASGQRLNLNPGEGVPEHNGQMSVLGGPRAPSQYAAPEMTVSELAKSEALPRGIDKIRVENGQIVGDIEGVNANRDAIAPGKNYRAVWNGSSWKMEANDGTTSQSTGSQGNSPATSNSGTVQPANPSDTAPVPGSSGNGGTQPGYPQQNAGTGVAAGANGGAGSKPAGGEETVTVNGVKMPVSMARGYQSDYGAGNRPYQAESADLSRRMAAGEVPSQVADNAHLSQMPVPQMDTPGVGKDGGTFKWTRESDGGYTLWTQGLQEGSWSKMKTVHDINEVKQSNALVMGGSNPGIKQNPEVNGRAAPPMMVNGQPNIEGIRYAMDMDPGFRQTLMGALQQYDSPESVAARQAAETSRTSAATVSSQTPGATPATGSGAGQATPEPGTADTGSSAQPVEPGQPAGDPSATTDGQAPLGLVMDGGDLKPNVQVYSASSDAGNESETFFVMDGLTYYHTSGQGWLQLVPQTEDGGTWTSPQGHNFWMQDGKWVPIP